jgi:hypothetical protein
LLVSRPGQVRRASRQRRCRQRANRIRCGRGRGRWLSFHTRRTRHTAATFRTHPVTGKNSIARGERCIWCAGAPVRGSRGSRVESLELEKQSNYRGRPLPLAIARRPPLLPSPALPIEGRLNQSALTRPSQRESCKAGRAENRRRRRLPQSVERQETRV